MYDEREDDDMREPEELEGNSSEADENARLAFDDDGIEGDGSMLFDGSRDIDDE